ncbi:MAG TPA: hypothetical protein PK954_23540, partial [Anaerolineales bacterium]|nr:hypothetical protein [Anaerolineales bacterium]
GTAPASAQVTRALATGYRDPAFGVDGRATVPGNVGYAVARDSAGRSLALTVTYPDQTRLHVTRLDGAGLPDPGLGITGTVTVLT